MTVLVHRPRGQEQETANDETDVETSALRTKRFIVRVWTAEKSTFVRHFVAGGYFPKRRYGQPKKNLTLLSRGAGGELLPDEVIEEGNEPVADEQSPE